MGTGAYAKELESWMHSEGHNQIQCVDHDHVNIIPLGSQVMVAFVNMQYRKNFFRKTPMNNYTWPAFVHSTALVTDLSSISPGVIVNPMSIVGHGAVLKDFCWIGTLSKIGHQSCLGQNTVVTSGTIIGGSTKIGSDVFFAQTCSIKDKINICDNASFVMNSLVKKDITKPGRYYGDRRMVDQ